MDLEKSYAHQNTECLHIPKPEDCIYTPCYCEENIWHLCDHVRKNQPGLLNYVHAVFLSNDCKVIPLWEQRAGTGEEKLVFWDYHVIFMYCKGSCCTIYDLDTCLPFPCDIKLYLERGLRSDHQIVPKYHRKLRVIPASEFLDNFSSDRSHMRKSDGSWIKPPPNYPPICPQGINNLDHFIQMHPTYGCGKVMTLDQFTEDFKYRHLGSDISTTS